MQVRKDVKFMQHADFKEIEELGSGGYGTVYKAQCNEHVVVLKTMIGCRTCLFPK